MIEKPVASPASLLPAGTPASDDADIPDDLLSLAGVATAAAERMAEAMKQALVRLVAPAGDIDPALIDQHQQVAHGFAWYATYAAALRAMQGWAVRLAEDQRFGEVEALLLLVCLGEYLAQMAGGIPMAQAEFARPGDLDVETEPLRQAGITRLIRAGTASGARMRLAQRLGDAGFGEAGLGDPALDMMRETFRRFTAERVEPYAHGWHLADRLIPIEIVEEMAELGVFGLTVPEEYGGLGQGKLAMCVVSEELSRGYIGVGSLGTRSEIAAELIRLGGTPEQRNRWLPRIASGEILPTAVFTEPDTGSDLGSLRTRATRRGETYRVTGNKTWITHGSRSDLMTLLARTGEAGDWRGLSMFLAEKPRGTAENPFPAPGMSGGEIGVLGYRGMKEYEIAFDGFELPATALLGGVEGQGFKQLMATFESARIQTASRAVGVAQNALELGLAYAQGRKQFGRSIAAFPRVASKLALMAAETMAARQLTYAAAREKDGNRRCDIEAGMAKLLAARVAWSNADNALQMHGGNGYALEYPISRVLCDARILNIFEGAAEIQAQVVARGLLSRRN
jgi:(2S)-methylsuccinyl-CoA dehydrogenase